MLDTYRHTQKISETPRAEEYRCLGELTAQLIMAEAEGKARLRAHALQDNQRFWQGLRLSSVSAINSLPPGLRAQFVTLADWVEKESVLAGLNGASLANLIAVNRQIMEGLKPFEGSLATDRLAAAQN